MSHSSPRVRTSRRHRPWPLQQAPGGLARGNHAWTLGGAFQASPTATIVTDASLQILAANPAYERLCGLRRSDWLGSHSP